MRVSSLLRYQVHKGFLLYQAIISLQMEICVKTGAVVLRTPQHILNNRDNNRDGVVVKSLAVNVQGGLVSIIRVT